MDQDIKKLMANTVRSLPNERLLDLVREKLSDDQILALVLDGERLPGMPAQKVPGAVADAAVLGAIDQGAHTSASIRRITGFTVNQLAAAMARLRRDGKVFMAGKRQFARYARTREEARAEVKKAGQRAAA